MSETSQLPPPDRSVKVPHLVFGLLFLGLAAVWALVSSGTLDAGSLPLVGPGILIAAGVVGLVASLANARNRSHRARQLSSDPYAEPYDGPYADATHLDTDTAVHPTDPSTDTTQEIR